MIQQYTTYCMVDQRKMSQVSDPHLYIVSLRNENKIMYVFMSFMCTYKVLYMWKEKYVNPVKFHGFLH